LATDNEEDALLRERVTRLGGLAAAELREEGGRMDIGSGKG